MGPTPRAASLPPNGVMLARGLMRRCPRCGQGKLFRRWLAMRPRCPRCGLRFEREEGGFLGAVAVNIGMTEVVFGASLLVALVVTWPRPPVIPLLAGGLVMNAILPVLFQPFSKTTWVAVELWMRRWNPEDLSDIDDPARS